MRVKCLAQEHSVVPRPGLKPGPFDPESSALTMRPPRLPLLYEVALALNVLELFAPYSLDGSMVHRRLLPISSSNSPDRSSIEISVMLKDRDTSDLTKTTKVINQSTRRLMNIKYH